ncbi:UDP-N-acetylenolpyruvoylglucosamine reductase [Borreliella mayonii]|uniref:UDP-N-acetylenolpyruvoylglucosamine reductase n=1 Tax=Borreliella mayonii TaxID=1674146 RepID=A0AAC9KYX7_9SPIR|nr:UDP-N-acetylmuramate dehydrogenase [Borreliella mayonii]APS98783.1 UDP-N-acetylenolpyruvoylglucosamine reductase [Borreliella mayonii]APS99883.1 UDP-N-acetylenolpyruvoylglucosamine reductase [Borreliella mayonii]
MLKSLNNFLKKINIKPQTKNLADYTTYKIGNISKLFLIPKNIQEAENIFKAAVEEKIKLFILGGGSNILVNDDKELDFPIIYTGYLNKIEIHDNKIIAECGANFENLCKIALDNSLGGLEFIYGLPGTLGGAVWMNARCFGNEISEILKKITFINDKGKTICKEFKKEDFKYKVSPFQNKNFLILKIELNLKKDNKKIIEEKMNKNKQARINRGHYLFPSSGSTFKNNKAFLKPSGQIIEECKLKGLSIGGATVSKYHGNFIININNATANDIKRLIEKVKAEVYLKTGLLLEEEVLYIGFK